MTSNFQPGAMAYTQSFASSPMKVAYPHIDVRAPTSQDVLYAIGTRWIDTVGNNEWVLTSQSSVGGVLSSNWSEGGNALATTSEPGIVQLATLSQLQNGNAPTSNYVPSSNDVATVIQAIVVGAVPPATETQQGIAEIATQAETNTGLDDSRIVTPLKLATYISGGSAGAGSFTDLTATGTISFTGATGTGFAVTAAAASSVGVTGAGIDLTLSSAAGSIVVDAGEAVANALQLHASDAAGGIDMVAGTGGLTLTNTGALSLAGSGASNVTIATGDLSIIDTASSIILNAGEAVADAIQLTTNAAGGVTMTIGTGGFNPTTTGKFTLVSTDNAAQAFYLHANGGTLETIQLRADQGTGAASVELLSDVGGVTLTGGAAAATAINFTNSNAGGGITMTAGTAGILPSTTGAFTVISTKNAAQAIELHANGGTTETIRLRADQGTAATSLDLLSDVGGITLNAGLGSASAINITSSAVGGGWTLNSGTAGVTLTNTGKLSLAAAAASDITVTGAFNLTLASTLGRVIASSGIAAANAITLTASDAAGGFALTSGTGGVTLTNTGALSLAAAAASNITVTGAFNLTLASTLGRVIATSGIAAANAITLTASDAAGGFALTSGTGGVTLTNTGALSLAAAAASDITVTGAFDLTLQSTLGAVNVISGEALADSINVTSAGGMNVVATGAAAKDTIITNTNGSMTLTAGENVTDAMNFTASGAASRINLSAGTGSIKFASGWIVPVKSLVFADSPYTVLGTDYFLSVDTSGGAITVTLPNAATVAGRTYVIRDTGGAAGASNITIGTGGGNLVGGGASAATKVISAAYAGATVYSNGTTWNYCYVA